jgi:opacity protein-like surface antigen
MFKKLFVKIFIPVFFLGNSAFAQYFAKRDSWKKEQNEFFVGGGATGFLGDLGGLNKIGTHYSYADLETSLTKTAWSGGFRHRISKKWASRTEFNFLQVSGNDALTQEPYRHNRNLNFKSNIFELSTSAEFALSFDKHGNKYKIKKTMLRRYHSYGSYYYLTAGIGVFYFNPKEQLGGTWYNIHQYSTEGQGLPGGPKQFSRISISIPFGIGAKYTIARRWSVGIEYLFRKTFTDYLDGVSTTYYDRAKLMQYKGATAVALADPSLGLIPGATAPNGDGSGAQRGDKRDKDSYFTLQIKVGYVLKSKKHRRTTKAKF